MKKRQKRRNIVKSLPQQPVSHMKKKPGLGIAAIIISLFVFISAVIVFIDAAFGISESHPLAGPLFYIVFFISIPELPLHSIAQAVGFPIVLPTIVVILALANFYQTEARKTFSVFALINILLAILLYLGTRILS